MKLSNTEIAAACKEAIIPTTINHNVYSINVYSHFYMDNYNFDMGDNGLAVFKSIIEDVVNGNAVKLGMGDHKGNKISISMNTDVLDFENVKIVINNDNVSLVPADKLIEAVDKSIFYQTRNREILSKLLDLKQFSIVEKDVGSPIYNDVDGWSEEVHPSDFCEECDFYSMILIGEPTEGGSWDLDENDIYPHSDNEPDLKDIKSRWIPLPVITEMLGIDLDWFIDNKHDDPIYHKSADIIAAINNAIA